jgi:GNAT superfamily N-acetyltransferase
MVSLAQLGRSPGVMAKLYDLSLAVREDVPIPPGEVRQPAVYERWLEFHQHPTLMQEAYFIAVADGVHIGTSNLWHSPEPDMIRTGLTAVRREYRRRGIAMGLKVRALSFAKELGFRRSVTDNASINLPMLAINDRLGFVRNPIWVHYVADWPAAAAGS